MSSSDQDMSDTSNMESPYSQRLESPYSSPSQQVPQLANFLTVLSCGDNYHGAGTSGPYLTIVEQPHGHFRFRYRSEMIGTHGCLLGKSSSTSKTKTHPTVELRNYTGKARIRCRLAQHNIDEEHPHKLLEDDQDRDVSADVPEGGSYKVGFGGMGIIHTAKKDVPGLLFKKFLSQGPNMNEKDLRMQCENLAKTINLNIVRLRFSAHDLNTDEEICPPVFSEPIHNMKSAATNDLKMCRASRCSGGPRGGDDVFLLVEKVNKKNIQIRFYELDANGEEVWTANGIFLQSDVHYQYAIVFRTPKYKDLTIEKDVNVFFELVRPSDGRTSDPRPFTYKADPVYRQNKKRKANSSYSSINSSSGGSLNSLDLPAPVQAVNNQNANYNLDIAGAEHMMDIKANIPKIPQPASTNESLMAQALLHEMSGTVTLFPGHAPPQPQCASPPQPQCAPQPHGSVGPPVLQLDSTEMDIIVNASIPPEERRRFDEMYYNGAAARNVRHGDAIPQSPVAATPAAANIVSARISFEEQKRFDDMYYSEYSRSLNDSFPLIGMSSLLADSAKIKTEQETSPSQRRQGTSVNEGSQGKPNKNEEYTAFYTAEDGKEVKELVTELCEIMRAQTGHKKHVVRAKLERLFELRLTNGDTFLHMTLCSNQASLEFIVSLIHSMKMSHLLNLRNNRRRTILHLAVKNESPKLVSFLISKGCDPMAEDNEGNNAIHYAVKYQTCLVPLLDAIRANKVPYDINAYNNEKQTPLHLAAVHFDEESTRTLLSLGALRSARDALGRTALHLAAYDGALPAARALLHRIPPGEIDAVDGQGNTALQIVCGGEQNENSLKILKLLLENNADPLKHEEFNKPAWKHCSDKPDMWDVMQKYVSQKAMREVEPDIKSEPEDEDESDDEQEWAPASLFELISYVEPVSRILDLSGEWRALARRLDKAGLIPGLAATRSPTRTLLEHVTTCNDYVSSEHLAQILDSMGQTEAAKIVRRFLLKKS